MKTVIPIFLLVLLIGCSQGITNTSESDVDRGAFDDRQYQNDLFGFSLLAPEGWEVDEYTPSTRDQMDQILSDFMANHEKENRLRMNDEKVYYGLFSLTKPTSTHHPIIVIGYAVDLRVLNGVSTAGEYLRHFGDRYPESPRVTISDVSTGDLGGREFSAISTNAIGIRRMEYATKIDTYLLLFSITADSSNGIAEARRLLDGVEFAR